jgi:HSP20 family molecular chaperone IbpA
MTSSSLVPVFDEQDNGLSSRHLNSNRYSIIETGQGNRTYSYEFDLPDYEPEQITVLLDATGRLRIKACRSLCHEFRREYYLGGPHLETQLVRNTIDPHGRLRVDVDVRARRTGSICNNSHILTFDLQGYRPKNVNVRVNEQGLLKITAQHHDTKFGNHIDREYYRQYQLPKHIGPEHVRARMDDNRLLTIELPASIGKHKQTWLPYENKPCPTQKSSCCHLM